MTLSISITQICIKFDSFFYTKCPYPISSYILQQIKMKDANFIDYFAQVEVCRRRSHRPKKNSEQDNPKEK